MKKIPKVKTGSILIAEPFILEGYFKRSVVAMCEHRPDGSVGFILNKTVEMNICDLIGDFPEFESRVNFGGPVATDTIHYMHCAGHLLEDSTEICNGVYWGGNFEKLKSLISSELVKPEHIRFFVGYSGWSEGQLHEELEAGTWMVDDMDANYVFKAKQKDLWKLALNNKGKVYTVIAQMDEFHSLN